MQNGNFSELHKIAFSSEEEADAADAETEVALRFLADLPFRAKLFPPVATVQSFATISPTSADHNHCGAA